MMTLHCTRDEIREKKKIYKKNYLCMKNETARGS